MIEAYIDGLLLKALIGVLSIMYIVALVTGVSFLSILMTYQDEDRKGVSPKYSFWSLVACFIPIYNVYVAAIYIGATGFLLLSDGE